MTSPEIPEHESENIQLIRKDFGQLRISFGAYQGTVNDAIDQCPPVRTMIDGVGPDHFVEHVLKPNLAED